MVNFVGFIGASHVDLGAFCGPYFHPGESWVLRFFWRLLLAAAAFLGQLQSAALLLVTSVTAQSDVTGPAPTRRTGWPKICTTISLSLINSKKQNADWCWLMLVDFGRCWLMLIDAECFWEMLIADADWCFLMLIDAGWCSSKVNQVFFCRTSGVSQFSRYNKFEVSPVTRATLWGCFLIGLVFNIVFVFWVVKSSLFITQMSQRSQVSSIALC